MSPQTVSRVKTSFARTLPVADAVAKAFYGRLFAQHPELRRLFADDMSEQERKLMLTLATVVENLDRLDRVVPVAEELARRHVSYGVVDAHYAMVGDALVWALKSLGGPRFDADTEAAWREAYGTLAQVMIMAPRKAA